MKLRIHHEETIAAIIPQYSVLGDHVEIIIASGRTISVPCRLRTVIRKVAKAHAADLTAVKRLAAPAARRPLLTPLPLSPRLVLFPIKIRQPRVEGDPCCAYINACMVTSISHYAAAPFQSLIQLQGNVQVPALWSRETVQRKLEESRLAQRTSPLAATTLRELPAPYGQEDAAEVIRRLARILPVLEATFGL